MIEITSRVIVILIAFPIVVGIFTILGVLLLRKDIGYWGNRLYALFFWIVAVGLFFNILYVFFEDIVVLKCFNITTIECVNIGLITLLLGNLVIFKGEKAIFPNVKTYLFILAMIITIIAHIYTPDVIVSTEDPPIIWTLPFGLYQLIFSQFVMITIIYLSLIFYRELTHELRGKFQRYLVGLLLLNGALLIITLGNMQIIQIGNIIISSILFLCLVLGAFLIYLGVVRKK